MKVITPGKLHWHIELSCLNLECRAVLEVEEKDFFTGYLVCADETSQFPRPIKQGIHFTCPECGTNNPAHGEVLEAMPEWVYEKAKGSRKEIA